MSSKLILLLFAVLLSSSAHASLALIKDDPSSGTNGGTCTSGSWITRTLSTVEGDTGSVSLSGSAFTLGAGTWEITWSTPGYHVENFKSRLYNDTTSSVQSSGSSEVSGSSDGTNARSFGHTIVTLSGSTTFHIEMQCQVTKTANGLGVAAGMGTEIYTIVSIRSL